MKASKTYTKLEVLKVVLAAAKTYKENLSSRGLLCIVKNDKKLEFYESCFSSKGFLHLTGLDTKLSARDFFKLAISNRLTVDDFEISNDELISKKMDVLPYAANLHKYAKEFGHLGMAKMSICADFGVGHLSFVVALRTLKNGDNIPVSLMKEDIRKITNDTYPIVAIVTKKIRESEKGEKIPDKAPYDTVTYKSKNINIDKLHFPKEIRDLLTDNAYYEIKPNARDLDLARKAAAATKEDNSQPVKQVSDDTNVHCATIIDDFEDSLEVAGESTQDNAKPRSSEKPSLKEIFAAVKAERLQRETSQSKAAEHTKPQKSKNNNIDL